MLSAAFVLVSGRVGPTRAGFCAGCLSWLGASMVVVSCPLVEGQPVVQLPAREPAALRAAVARLDPAALARFEADWTAARRETYRADLLDAL